MISHLLRLRADSRCTATDFAAGFQQRSPSALRAKIVGVLQVPMLVLQSIVGMAGITGLVTGLDSISTLAICADTSPLASPGFAVSDRFFGFCHRAKPAESGWQRWSKLNAMKR